MALKSISCPACGAPVEFRAADTVLLVCPYCHSTLLRREDKLDNLGRMGDLATDTSPLQIGTEGIYRKVHFTLIGRIQYRYDRGIWNEWYMLQDDGRGGWLSDADGNFVVSFLEDDEASIAGVPPFAQLNAGEEIRLRGNAFQITNVELARCVAGEGELPFRVGEGYEAPVADLRLGRIFATLDYADGTPVLYVGEAIAAADLKLSHLRDEAAITTEEKGARQLDCKACGTPLNISTTATCRVACDACGTLMDVDDDRLNIISRTQQRMRIEPTLALGSRGRLYGIDYQVIGFLRRRTVIEDKAYFWDEYLILGRKGELHWLSCANGHWNLITPAADPPGRTRLEGAIPFTYRGESYRHFQTYRGEVVYVVGEFNWQIAVGDSARIYEFIAPPQMLACEKTGNEITWSLASYLEPEEVREAFEHKRSLPAKTGIYPNQPNPASASLQHTCLYFWWLAGAALMLQLILMLVIHRAPLDQEIFSYAPGIESHISRSFELKDNANSLRIAHESNVDNNWLDMELTLVREDAPGAWVTYQELSYYHGVDDGESWSEGNRSDDLVFKEIPAGRYHLEIEGETAKELRRSVITSLTIGRSPPRWSNLWLVLGWLVLFPLWSRWRFHHFEHRRWMESDHPPQSASGEDD